MSTFTATNGSSPKATNAETIAVPSTVGALDSSNGGPAPLPPPPGDQQPSGDQPPSTASPTQEDRDAVEGSNSDRSTFQASTSAENESSHKRKRSDESTEDARRELHAHPERNLAGAGPADPDRPFLTTERGPYDRDYRDRQAYREENRERDREQWYSPQEHREDRHSYHQAASAMPDPAQTDEQMGEALSRALEQRAHGDYPQISPDGDDGSVGYHYETPDRLRGGVARPSDPKKKKRNFSNRTKTGCLTCRRRKKKCDESKPECKWII